MIALNKIIVKITTTINNNDDNSNVKKKKRASYYWTHNMGSFQKSNMGGLPISPSLT